MMPNDTATRDGPTRASATINIAIEVFNRHWRRLKRMRIREGHKISWTEYMAWLDRLAKDEKK